MNGMLLIETEWKECLFQSHSSGRFSFVVGTVSKSFRLRTSALGLLVLGHRRWNSWFLDIDIGTLGTWTSTLELLVLGHHSILTKMRPRQGCFQLKWFFCILFLAILVISSTILTIFITSSCYFHLFCPVEFDDGQEQLFKDPVFWSIVLSSIALMIVLVFIAIKVINISRINKKLSESKPLEMKPIKKNHFETREKYQKVKRVEKVPKVEKEEDIYVEVS